MTVVFFGLILGSGCTGPKTGITSPTADYVEALESGVLLEAGSDLEQQAIAGVTGLFSDYSGENIRAHVRSTYAETFFFRDGFRDIRKLDELEAYMVHGTEPLRFCTFTFEEPVRQGRDYYLRWVMKVSLNRDKEGQFDEILGMSHLRFNEQGRVVFHQDYWDPSDLLYRRIPVAGWMIHKIKQRL